MIKATIWRNAHGYIILEQFAFFLGEIANLFLWVLKNKRQFRKMPHYFKNYHKHITIYKNGHAIIINSFEIVFNNHDTEFLERGLNIEDGKLSANFDSLKNMKRTPLKNRFERFGFWVHSKDKIIEATQERYWDDINFQGMENIKAKENPKELRWVFKFNHSNIELNKPYHIIYILSVPGMFPIEDGKLDLSQINDPDSANSAFSSIHIVNAMINLKYTVSFENGIELAQDPNALFASVKNKNKVHHPLLTNEYDIIYNKYICNIKKPQMGSDLKIVWKFKGGSDDE